jgi:Family of unknown function (DUF6174)
MVAIGVVGVSLLVMAIGHLGPFSRNQSVIDSLHRHQRPSDARRPPDYRFVYQLSGMVVLPSHTVTVRQGHPTSVSPPYGGGLPAPRSVDDVFRQALHAAATATSVAVTYDPRTGVPTEVDVVPTVRGRDDVSGFGIRQLRVLPAVAGT